MNVVYFDQPMGACEAKSYLKYFYSEFSDIFHVIHYVRTKNEVKRLKTSASSI